METRVFAAFLSELLEKIPGKKAFQKMVYFGQVLGIPLDHSYKMYFYGPYSETVADELASAERNNIISQINAFCYGPGENSEAVIEQGSDQIIENIDAIEKLVGLFGNMSPLELELYATVHFIDNSQKSLYNNNDKTVIMDVVKRVKGTKFEITQIETAYNELENWGLLM